MFDGVIVLSTNMRAVSVTYLTARKGNLDRGEEWGHISKKEAPESRLPGMVSFQPLSSHIIRGTRLMLICGM